MKASQLKYFKEFGATPSSQEMESIRDQSEEYLAQVLLKGYTYKIMDHLRI